jgi:hypothetical protein
MEIRLLTTSVSVPSFYGSIVPAGRFEVATLAITPSEVFPTVDFVWSAPARVEGYATPQSSENDQGWIPWKGFTSEHASGSDWYTLNAAFQYSVNESIPASVYEHLVNLYA